MAYHHSPASVQILQDTDLYFSTGDVDVVEQLIEIYGEDRTAALISVALREIARDASPLEADSGSFPTDAVVGMLLMLRLLSVESCPLFNDELDEARDFSHDEDAIVFGYEPGDFVS